jgi:cytochrome c oxidase subunit 2
MAGGLPSSDRNSDSSFTRFGTIDTESRGDMNDAPMGFLRGYGTHAHPVTALTWGLLAISIAVIVIITGLLIVAIIRARPAAPPHPSGKPALTEASGGAWISIGVGISTVVLFAAVVWTMQTLAAIVAPATAPQLTLEVDAKQFWWDVRYTGDESFVTANEIHIPVGAPVRVRLSGQDVIHSFWVPALAGKTDVIPGQTNLTWLEADQPGTYRGQCTEYCGVQHANMALLVIAEPPDVFDAWRRQQLAPAVLSPNATEGQRQFVTRCGDCHTVRGTAADGKKGPDLTHLMSRTTLGAGTLPNTPGHLAGWIANAQAIKPGNGMPPSLIPPAELAGIRAFLETLL